MPLSEEDINRIRQLIQPLLEEAKSHEEWKEITRSRSALAAKQHNVFAWCYRTLAEDLEAALDMASTRLNGKPVRRASEVPYETLNEIYHEVFKADPPVERDGESFVLNFGICSLSFT